MSMMHLVIWTGAIMVSDAEPIGPVDVASLYRPIDGAQVLSVDRNTSTVVFIGTRLTLTDPKGTPNRLLVRRNASSWICTGKATISADAKDVAALQKRARTILGPEAKLKHADVLSYEAQLDVDSHKVWQRTRANGAIKELTITAIAPLGDKEPKEALLKVRVYWEQDLPSFDGRVIIDWDAVVRNVRKSLEAKVPFGDSRLSALVREAVQEGHIRFEPKKGKAASSPDNEMLALLLKDQLIRNLLKPLPDTDKPKRDPDRPLTDKSQPTYSLDVTYRMIKDIDHTQLDSMIDVARSRRIERTLVLSTTGGVVR